MSGHRQAALALYALSPPDQESILAELPDADRQQLRSYLAELTELGFDDAPPAASGSGTARLFSLAPRTPATPADRVRAAAPQVVAELLEDEPAALVAQLLAMDDWPWRTSVLGMMPGPRHDQVQRALDARRSIAAAPACSAFLVECLAAQLERVVAPAPRSALSQLVARATAWTR